MANGRRLRSTDDHGRNKKNLFNFESINPLLYKDQKISIVKGPPKGKPYHYFLKGNENFEPKKDSAPFKIKEDDIRVPRRVKDELPDSLFEGFHRKMTKEEKSMSNVDKMKILLEVDDFRTCLETMQHNDWNKHIAEITHIENPYDISELEEKRTLTIKELKFQLERYGKWKRGYDSMSADIKRRCSDLDEDTDSDFTRPLEEVRSKRLAQARKKFGPAIKLNLGNGYAIVVDVHLPPRVVKYEHNRKENEYISENNDSKSNKTKNTEHDLKKSKNATLGKKAAFRFQVPKLGRNKTFSLTNHWDVKTGLWKEERMRLRRKIGHKLS